MPRKPRFNLPGYPFHVIQRGNNRQPCFFKASDYRFYLDCLSIACEKYFCQVHAYVLMTNHVHLLVTPKMEYGVSQLMQSVGRRYVRQVNKLYGRSGSLWEGRYKANLVDQDGHLLTCYRYVELNPVRAGMVEHPRDYPWSSYDYNAHGKPDDLISPHSIYLGLGRDKASRQQGYWELFKNSLDEQQLDDIRKALNHELAFGSEHFKNSIQLATKRRTRLRHAGRPLDPS